MKHLIVLLGMLTWLSGNVLSQPCNEPPAADDCLNAPLICDLNILDGYCTSLENIQTGNGPTPLCNNGNGGVPNNPIWVAFYAGCPTLHFTIIPSNCTPQGGSDGIQVGIYGYDDPNGCTNSLAPPDEYIVCSGNCPMNNPMILVANDLKVGRIYYMVIDGCAGAYCDISISIDETCDPPYIDDWELSALEGPTEACTGSNRTYTIQEPIGATKYHWYLDGQLIEESEFYFFDITWTMAGTYELCVDASNHCVSESENPPPQCLTITVTDLLGIDPDSVLICENETYFYAGADRKPGTYEFNLVTPGGCDSIVKLIINSSPVATTDLGNFIMCKKDTLFLENTYFTCNFIGTNEVVYQQAEAPYCDSIITFDILCLYAKTGIIPPEVLDEKVDSVTLDGSSSVYDPLDQPLEFTWYKVDTTGWTWWSDSVITTTSELGTYCLVMSVYTSDSLTYCSDTACVVVDSIMSAIHPVAAIGQWLISPVPARDLLTIQCQGEKCPGNGVLEIWDVLGRKQYGLQIEQWTNVSHIPVTEWPGGPYWITWTDNDRQRMLIGKAIVQR